MIEIPDDIKTAMLETSEESAEFMKVEILKHGGEKFLTKLGEAKSIVEKIIVILEGLPGESEKINITCIKDASRFLDAVAEKFIDSVS